LAWGEANSFDRIATSINFLADFKHSAKATAAQDTKLNKIFQIPRLKRDILSAVVVVVVDVAAAAVVGKKESGGVAGTPSGIARIGQGRERG
jgi:hypothetical protein